MAFIRKRESVDEFEPPTKKPSTEKDQLIKELSQKQLKTNVTLQGALNNEKHFEKSETLTSSDKATAGLANLNKFQNITANSERVENLVSVGLSESDIQLLDDYGKGWDFVYNKYKNANREVLQKRVDSLLETVESAEKVNKRDKTHVDDPQTLFLKEARDEANSPDKQKKDKSTVHPMENIKQLECEIKERGILIDVAKIRRKARKLGNRLKDKPENNKIKEVINKTDHFDLTQSCSKSANSSKSKWDVEYEEPTKQNNIACKKTYTCQPQNYYTIKDGVIVKIDAPDSTKT